ncbi:MAG: short-chain dehydrogenase [Modestobacter sp.]|nr:short-chain dehydrogenase [Modestobacter sp.]
MTTTLITGANKGLGREAARRLVQAGHDVYLVARDSERGAAAARELGCRFVVLDVLDDDSVTAAAAAVEAESGALDVLVNNAGISGGAVPAEDTTADDVERVHATNVLGVVRVTHAFLPLLLRSPAPAIVNVSSGLGSLAVTTDPTLPWSAWRGLAYPSSKAALNMLTSQYAKSFPQIRINAVDPGYTATDLNGHGGTQSVEEGAEAIVAMASIGPDGPTGGFFDRHGVLPW